VKFGLRKLAAAIALGGLSIGLIGQGLHAQFTVSGAATQTFTVGNMQLQLFGYHQDGGNWVVDQQSNSSLALTCESVSILQSTGDSHGTCLFDVEVSGNIAKNLTITADYAAASWPEQWAFQQNLNFDGAKYTSTSPVFPASPYDGLTVWHGTPAAGTMYEFDPYLSWSDLTNASFNDSITVTYTITASE
jgi:hypothetical protein